MTVTRSRFLGNTAALGISMVLATGLTLAQMKILAAHLPLAIFGLFASLRGLSLLVSMLAANGFPQLLVRFLPELATQHARARALRLSSMSLAVTVGLTGVLMAGVLVFAHTFFRQVPPQENMTQLLAWFALTTLAIAVKLVVYGGFNGLRRFGAQTVIETVSLAAQVIWMAAVADALSLTRLFEITAVTSLAAVLAAVPWYYRSLVRDVVSGVVAPGARESYLDYWTGALGLSLVALAFTDVDRWVLSNVLALEALSLFHVASRISRLANRFIAIPVLAFQPEATRLHAEGREDALGLSLRTFFKTNVLLGVLAAVAIIVYAGRLIELASSREFLDARKTLWLLAAATPLTAMTASLTAVMKALDGVRAAFYCDLAWAAVYVAGLVTLTVPLGVEGTGVALLAASTVQLVLAFRLASLRPSVAEAVSALLRSVACGVLAFLPAVAASLLKAPLVVDILLAPVGVWIYFRMTRRIGILSADERMRLRQVTGGGRTGSLAGWMT